jgi:hypothetical protein
LQKLRALSLAPWPASASMEDFSPTSVEVTMVLDSAGNFLVRWREARYLFPFCSVSPATLLAPFSVSWAPLSRRKQARCTHVCFLALRTSQHTHRTLSYTVPLHTAAHNTFSHVPTK